MTEDDKIKLADFLDKEVGYEEVSIASIIDKVYDHAVKVEREKQLNRDMPPSN